MGDIQPKCQLCGEPMPKGEEMFKFHGHSGPCPKPPLPRQSRLLTGIERIAKERQRQIDEEGWTPEHDDGHDDGQLAMAAVCYAAPVKIYEQLIWQTGKHFQDPWPWDPDWDKRPYDEETGDLIYGDAVDPKERIRNLEKAGALIAAEIDRLQRVKDHG